MIAAIDKNRGLGYKQNLLYKISTDLKRFKRLTEGNIVLLGRKTLESIGQSLPHRENIVLTNDQSFHEKGYKSIKICHSVDEVLNYYKENGKGRELFICGGEEVYKQFISHANKVYLTLIHDNSKESDTFFPELDLSEWEEDARLDICSDIYEKYDYSFIDYIRKYK